MQNTIELSHSFWNADRDQEIQITVKVDNDGTVEEVTDIAIWSHEEGRRMELKALLNLELCEAAGIVDPMLEQVDWHQLYAEHIADEAEYNALSRLEE